MGPLLRRAAATPLRRPPLAPPAAAMRRPAASNHTQQLLRPVASPPRGPLVLRRSAGGGGQRSLVSTRSDDRPAFVPGDPARIQHPDHTLQRELLRARTPRQLLELWEREFEEAGWFTAIVVLDRMRICVEKNKPLHDRQDPRLQGLLEFLHQALSDGGMSGFTRLVHHTADLTTLCSALERLKLTSCSLYDPLLVKIEEELDEDDDDTAFASG